MTGSANRFGLIGNPITTSGSPALFSAAYGGRFPYDLIEGADFENSWARFLSGYRAINVTAPFKEPAFRKVVEAAAKGKGELDGSVLKIGATNLVVLDDSGILHAHNSDFSGIIYSVAEALFPGIVAETGSSTAAELLRSTKRGITELYGRKPQALVVGCGGAGKAAAVAAAQLGFSTAIMNRSMDKVRILADKLPEYDFYCAPIDDFRASFRECDLVIYTLPVALPILGSLTREDFKGSGISQSKIILEANYKTPSFGPDLLRIADSVGAQYVPGWRWLLWQAVSGYGIMTGEEPDKRAMCSAIRR